MKGIMILGTASDVGKSLIATGICRAYANECIRVAPFKSQNMSNNSYVTIDGKEIGRAQGIQAEAARTEATVMMNPILLKPRSDQHSEVILFGKALKTMSGKKYRDAFYEQGLKAIQTAFENLDQEFEMIVMEGAGSPVEINLKDRELVNMKVAEIADVPAVLVADIDRGGVFASIIGTLELLTPEERSRVKGLIINKFRGDLSLFEDGVKWLESKTGIPILGVLPYIENHMIDGEDSLSIPASTYRTGLDIAVIKPPYISNYSDIEPFYFEADVSIRWVSRLDELGHPDAVILPGTKSTIRDLQYFKAAGFDTWLVHYAENGGFIAGICGGYQMLGERLIDPYGSDTGLVSAQVKGLGIIPAVTAFLPDKTTTRTEAVVHPNTGFNLSVEGYEIHLGETLLSSECQRFLLLKDGKEEGYYGKNGRVIGTYLHHLFNNDEWRNHWLNSIRKAKGEPERDPVYISRLKDQKYDELAAHIKRHLDWEGLKEISEKWGTGHELV
ncbi:cobyric acid synthase [Mesobacillus selenatarsenatis]|uniref:Cobyric acid synthase n=1 Tax=Mesobacillus selenatarsenatis (strain DSM 18680 / JCM 14380 / FERM P-15431 / SF-1) TaxID=1321606 RepID=A0A0A8WX53_MESS1|nr:cobyric acid synthase [Mesobacillus selenatarsenatis]GAM12203.1 cobyric acid synthase [Mesobacillus selenatarsenatis SF-1]